MNRHGFLPAFTLPQLPAGYAGMPMLSLAPPLWRRVMHPRIAAFQSR